MRKSAIALTLSILMIFNFIFTSVYAAEGDTSYKSGTVDFGHNETLGDLTEASSEERWNELLLDGSTTVEEGEKEGDTYTTKNEEKRLSNGGSVLKAGLGKVVVSVFSIVPKVLNWLLSKVTGTTTFTIGELLSNQYDITGIKFWEQQTDGENKTTINQIRDNVSIWYYSVRNLAAIAMVAILVYIGLRLAILIATGNGSPKEISRYKQMITDWFIGLALMLVLHILMVAIISLAEALTNIIINIGENIAADFDSGGIEAELTDNAWGNIWKTDNAHPFWTFLIYLMLTFYQIKFFLSYVFRALRIYLYVIISPLVCMTYSIDKISDNTSQAFNSWINEFMGEVLIQPIQLITYSIFILSAGTLMKEAPILLVIFLAGISNIDKIIRNIILPKAPKFSRGPSEFKLSRPSEWFSKMA